MVNWALVMCKIVAVHRTKWATGSSQFFGQNFMVAVPVDHRRHRSFCFMIRDLSTRNGLLLSKKISTIWKYQSPFLGKSSTDNLSNIFLFRPQQKSGVFKKTFGKGSSKFQHQKKHPAIGLHPPKQTWNLKMDPWKRRFLLETIISRFHVNFRGCIPNKTRP